MRDIYTLMQNHADELFYAPYRLAQDAIGETDGGIASLFECDLSDHGSGLANAGAHLVVQTILEHVGEADFVRRAKWLAPPDVAQRFASAELLTKDAIPEIAAEVASTWHEMLKGVFTEVPSEQIDDCLQATTNAATEYLKVQYVYTDEHNGSFGPGRS